MAATGLLAAACASGGGRQDTIAFAPWGQDDYQYRVLAGDELRLNFIVETDLNGPVIIGPDGDGVFPIIGSVPIEGLTVDQAGERLTEAYAGVLRNPQVQMLVTEYGSSQVYVGGEVRTPGVTPLQGPLNVAQAVMAAGGFAETARTGKVVVLRRQSSGQLARRTVDVDRLLRAEAGEDFLLRPGDLIFVPRSSIAEVNLFVRQYLTGVLPFNFGFSYDLNRFTN